jgi:predicted alpha/beta-fold hydrolase
LLLRAAHVQSVLAAVPPRRHFVRRRTAALLARSQTEILDCGAGVRLLADHTPPADAGRRRTVVLLHGWEGSAASLYMLTTAGRLWRQGFRVMRLNLRDHGDSHHLNREIFHSCRLAEVLGAVRAVQRRFPEEQLDLAGFSLGGNFALRIAACAPQEGIRLRRVVAICPVLDPRDTLAALDNGLPVYRHYFIRRWSVSLERKRAAFPQLYDFGELSRFRTLRAMTDYFVRHYTGFPDLNTYLEGYALTGRRLAGLDVPSHLLLAEDDPVIPSRGLERVAVTAALRVQRSRFGGHCGFIADYRLTSWLDDYLAEILE